MINAGYYVMIVFINEIITHFLEIPHWTLAILNVLCQLCALRSICRTN